ncbi:S41 family peptidase [Chryseobacterium sp. MYb264]|uniref:S41 family peptidase n=1 Tax=Chryseobacterium sp. MYb264 TaxID=2745153 RepID=UPI002E1223C3|nr:S41 family peptidase [Chryseobacterium sp. MYb264]
MILKRIAIVFSVIGLSVSIKAQRAKTSKDSIQIFYRQLFSDLKKSYVDRKSVDWKLVESETNEHLKEYDHFMSSLEEIKVLFGKINATHCIIMKGENRYALKSDIPSKDKMSEQFISKFNTKPGFEVKVIDGEYGYILMPSISSLDQTSDKIRKIAQPLYDQIAETKINNKLKGWIVDLRFNTGGNSEPMLLALYDFLGDHEVWGTLDSDRKAGDKIKLSKGAYIYNGKKNSEIIPKGELLDQTKVAVITGLLTASSGEVTALAFKGRPHTIMIGETTLGYTTSNILTKLPFNFDMALTVGYDTDRNGIFYEKIVPDIAVTKGDNFENLLMDKNIQEAIKFFKSV